MGIGPVIAARREAFYTALTSGEFTQTKNALEKVTDKELGTLGHCCLGVATRVAMKDGLPLVAYGNTEGNFGSSITYFQRPDGEPVPGAVVNVLAADAEEGALHPDAVEWYGYPERDPVILVEACPNGNAHCNHDERASACNDGRNMTFAEIANAFRASFPADPLSDV